MFVCFTFVSESNKLDLFQATYFNITGMPLDQKS